MVRCVAAPALVLFALGCGGAPSDQPDLGRVTGVVTFDGEPLPNAEVTFQPEKGRPSYGTTDDDGEYSLLYSQSADGAAIGRHVVSVRTFKEEDDDEGNTKITAERVPDVYNDASELSFKVESGSQEFDIAIDSKKGKVVQPNK